MRKARVVVWLATANKMARNNLHYAKEKRLHGDISIYQKRLYPSKRQGITEKAYGELKKPQ